MSDIVYAVHTRSCTYLLDDDGICRWVLSRSGARSDDRCVGAQFVAALDLQSRGGLVGELRIGAQALFIRSEGGRFVLIRTKPIEHIEIRGAEAEAPPEDDPYGGAYPEPEPVVLPSHHAVAGVFSAPVSAPEPPPPSEQRVIVQTPHPYAGLPPSEIPPPPPMRPLPEPPARAFPEPPPRYRPEPPARLPTEPPTGPLPRGQTEPPPPPAPPPLVARPPLPIAPPRVPGPRARDDQAQATQPLPSSPALPVAPPGPAPAWPPMLAPPPPLAEFVPLVPRPAIPSAEELDDADLEEVDENDQVYSTEVTVSLPLFRTDSRHGQPWRR